MQIKIRGLGHDLTYSNIHPATTNLSHVQSLIEADTNLPPVYQRILCNGKSIYPPRPSVKETSGDDDKLQDKDMESNHESSIDNKDDLTIENILATYKIRIVKDTLKMMLMHNASYSKDKSIIDSITALSKELKSFEVEYEKLQEELMRNGGNDDDNDEGKKKELERIQEKLKQIQHMIIEISCRLDAIDVSSSDSLRTMRKGVLKRVDELEKNIAATL